MADEKTWKTWKDFEYSTLEATKKLNHGKTVKPNQYVKGTISGGRRQIDIKVDDYDFIDVECKDHKVTIDVTTVEQFAGKLKDEGAKSGIIVSNSPFTKPAIKTAEHYGIELKHLLDTGHDNASLFLFEAPVIMTGYYVETMRIGFEHTGFEAWALRSDTINTTTFVGKKKTTLYKVFRELWNKDSELLKDPGTYQLAFEKVPIEDYNGLKMNFDKITYIYRVSEVFRLGRMGIEKGRGLYDVKNKTLHSSENMTFKPINIDDIANWPEITKEKAEKMQVNFRFTMLARLPNNPPKGAGSII